MGNRVGERMRVCIHKETGRLIEAQHLSHKKKIPHGILLKNALVMGYGKNAIEEKTVDKKEYEDLLKTMKKIEAKQ